MQPLPPDTAFLTVKDAARELGITDHVLYRMVRQGDISAYRTSRRNIRFKKTEIAEFLEASRIKVIRPDVPVPVVPIVVPVPVSVPDVRSGLYRGTRFAKRSGGGA